MACTPNSPSALQRYFGLASVTARCDRLMPFDYGQRADGAVRLGVRPVCVRALRVAAGMPHAAGGHAAQWFDMGCRRSALATVVEDLLPNYYGSVAGLQVGLEK